MEREGAYPALPRGLFDRAKQRQPARPRLIARFPVRLAGFRLLAEAHERVTCTGVDHRIVFLPVLLHRRARRLDRRVHALVDASIESVHRTVDPGHAGIVLWTRAIENKG